MTETELLRMYRRDLHQIPEVGFDLPQTLSYVGSKLEELGDACTILWPCPSTVCALFDCGSPSTAAIRTDMDALPVTERTGALYASRIAGHMHACGHDGHMAMALALCQWLAAHKHELVRNILVVFQPAEETSGGARRVCESGVFQQYSVDRIFGFHLWPELPKGQIASRPGALLASSNEVDVTFLGKGSHIAKWQEGRDALLSASRFVTNIYACIDELQPHEPVLLRFGTLSAGTVRNAIAASAHVHGSLRTFHFEDRDRAEAAIATCADAAARGAGCTATTHFSQGNPPVVNDAALYELARAALPSMQVVDKPLLIAEDFAWYQLLIPGVFLLLGTGTGIPLHADTFDFDESVLLEGLNAYKRLVHMP